jgi:hypothetical protein
MPRLVLGPMPRYVSDSGGNGQGRDRRALRGGRAPGRSRRRPPSPAITTSPRWTGPQHAALPSEPYPRLGIPGGRPVRVRGDWVLPHDEQGLDRDRGDPARAALSSGVSGLHGRWSVWGAVAPPGRRYRVGLRPCTGIEPRAAPSAHAAAISLAPDRPDHDDDLPFTADVHVIHDRPLDAQQPRPIPLFRARRFAPPLRSSLEKPEPRRGAACAPDQPLTSLTATAGAPES